MQVPLPLAHRRGPTALRPRARLLLRRGLPLSVEQPRETGGPSVQPVLHFWPDRERLPLRKGVIRFCLACPPSPDKLHRYERTE
jgi:hypothetical protein